MGIWEGLSIGEEETLESRRLERGVSESLTKWKGGKDCARRVEEWDMGRYQSLEN